MPVQPLISGKFIALGAVLGLENADFSPPGLFSAPAPFFLSTTGVFG
jgi:hypothetical protein